MKHFFNDVEGWFTFPVIYSLQVAKAKDKAHFVEVGSWKGKSTAYMAVEIINSKKDIQFDCVDTWEGSDEPAHHIDKDVIDNTLYETFIKNMKPAEGYYKPVRMDSVSASRLYEDESLDFVFIDAAHDYESVKADIKAWYPKVKIGGTIAGHDYNWQSVKKAVDECLGDKVKPRETEYSWLMEK
jgi:Methyltransferase domain